jgi:hypothetical protein
MAKPKQDNGVAGHVAGANLVPAHPGNANAAKHAAWSRNGRLLEPRAQEIADALMAAPHVVELDRIAAEEIGRLQNRCGRVAHGSVGSPPAPLR